MTGVSLVFVKTMVWKTDSSGPQGLKSTFWVLALTMGIKGCEPGANECPHNGRLIQRGGSISSLLKSAYFDNLDAPSRVLFLLIDLDFFVSLF